jgi:hypothetical protein
VRDGQTWEGVEVVRKAFVMVEPASDTALSESEIQDFPIVPEAVLLRRDNVASRKPGEIVR